jgi:hypothetical protein
MVPLTAPDVTIRTICWVRKVKTISSQRFVVVGGVADKQVAAEIAESGLHDQYCDGRIRCNSEVPFLNCCRWSRRSLSNTRFPV